MPRLVAISLISLLALLVIACTQEQEVTPSETPSVTVASSPEASPTASPAVAATIAATTLPTLAPGFTWQQVPASAEFGFPGYAVQVPIDWITTGLLGNPVHFSPPDATAQGFPKLLTMVTPVSAGWEHPILINLPMSGTTCGDGVPRGSMPGNTAGAPDPVSPSEFQTGALNAARG